MTVLEHIRFHFLESIGFPQREYHKMDGDYSLETLKNTEWSRAFEKRMRDCLVMGALRYGRLKEPNKPNFDMTGDAIRRIRLFQEDGNVQHLVDVANMCLLEFEIGKHPKRHDNASSEFGHTEIIDTNKY